jgi:hypothetical protein
VQWGVHPDWSGGPAGLTQIRGRLARRRDQRRWPNSDGQEGHATRRRSNSYDLELRYFHSFTTLKHATAAGRARPTSRRLCYRLGCEPGGRQPKQPRMRGSGWYRSYNFLQNRENFLHFHHFLHFHENFLHFHHFFSILNLYYSPLFCNILCSEIPFRSRTSNVMHVPCVTVLTKGHEIRPRGSSSNPARNIQYFSPL